MEVPHPDSVMALQWLTKREEPAPREGVGQGRGLGELLESVGRITLCMDSRT